MTYPRPFKWYYSQADLMCQDCPFKLMPEYNIFLARFDLIGLYSNIHDLLADNYCNHIRDIEIAPFFSVANSKQEC